MRGKKAIVLGSVLVFSLWVGSAAAATRVRIGVAVGHVRPVVAPVRVVRVVPAGFWAPVRTTVVVGLPVNYGRVDFNVKPKNSRIYVDGAYIGIADDWDGGFFGTTASLKAGPHTVRIVAPDGRSIVRRIYVMPGRELDFNFVF
ncbi:MAG: hypothetical protein Kow00109_28990 [Acidobacteriota bacterium]